MPPKNVFKQENEVEEIFLHSAVVGYKKKIASHDVQYFPYMPLKCMLNKNYKKLKSDLIETPKIKRFYIELELVR